jgi:hypothetical protein
VEPTRNQFDSRPQQQPEPARGHLEEEPKQQPSLVPQQPSSQTAFSSRYPLSSSAAPQAQEPSLSPYTSLNQDGVSPYFQQAISQHAVPAHTQSPTPTAPGQHVAAASYAPFSSLPQQQATIPPFGQQTDYSHLYGQDSLRSLVSCLQLFIVTTATSANIGRYRLFTNNFSSSSSSSRLRSQVSLVGRPCHKRISRRLPCRSSNRRISRASRLSRPNSSSSSNNNNTSSNSTSNNRCVLVKPWKVSFQLTFFCDGQGQQSPFYPYPGYPYYSPYGGPAYNPAVYAQQNLGGAPSPYAQPYGMQAAAPPGSYYSMGRPAQYHLPHQQPSHSHAPSQHSLGAPYRQAGPHQQQQQGQPPVGGAGVGGGASVYPTAQQAAYQAYGSYTGTSQPQASESRADGSWKDLDRF